jgi:hypothetical protein
MRKHKSSLVRCAACHALVSRFRCVRVANAWVCARHDGIGANGVSYAVVASATTTRSGAIFAPIRRHSQT